MGVDRHKSNNSRQLKQLRAALQRIEGEKVCLEVEVEEEVGRTAAAAAAADYRERFLSSRLCEAACDLSVGGDHGRGGGHPPGDEALSPAVASAQAPFPQ